MEGPGGYQFVGRTVQMWNRYRQTREFCDGKRWLLRFFDQLRFYPVSAEELLKLREDFPLGKTGLRIEPGSLKLCDYQQFLRSNATSIASFKARQQAAFVAERERWRAMGREADNQVDVGAESASGSSAVDTIPPGCMAISSPVTGSVWEMKSIVGGRVTAGEPLIIVESMKMEIAVQSEQSGMIVEIRCQRGQAVLAGETLLIVRPGV